MSSASAYVNVVVRVRPGSKNAARGSRDIDIPSPTHIVCKDGSGRPTDFDAEHVFDASQTQDDVFTRLGRPMIDAVASGETLNSIVIACGARGAGKTHTLFGEAHCRGLVPRVVEELLRSATPSLAARMVEITSDEVIDLTAFYRHGCAPTTNGGGEIQHPLKVTQAGQVTGMIEAGKAHRRSQSSHFVVHLKLEHSGAIVFVDLSSPCLETIADMNTLANVLGAVHAGQTRQLPFHESMLTDYLSPFLTLNSAVTLLATITKESTTSTLDTLWFTKRFHPDVQNRGVVGQTSNLLQEITRLRNELATALKSPPASHLPPGTLSPMSRTSRRTSLSIFESMPKKRASVANVTALPETAGLQQQGRSAQSPKMAIETKVYESEKIANLKQRLEASSAEVLRLTADMIAQKSMAFVVHERSTAEIKDLEQKMLMKEIDTRERVDAIRRSTNAQISEITAHSKEVAEKASAELRRASFTRQDVDQAGLEKTLRAEFDAALAAERLSWDKAKAAEMAMSELEKKSWLQARDEAEKQRKREWDEERASLQNTVEMLIVDVNRMISGMTSLTFIIEQIECGAFAHHGKSGIRCIQLFERCKIPHRTLIATDRPEIDPLTKKSISATIFKAQAFIERQQRIKRQGSPRTASMSGIGRRSLFDQMRSEVNRRPSTAASARGATKPGEHDPETNENSDNNRGVRESCIELRNMIRSIDSRDNERLSEILHEELAELGSDPTIDRLRAVQKERDYYKSLAAESTRKQQELRVAHNAQTRLINMCSTPRTGRTPTMTPRPHYSVIPAVVGPVSLPRMNRPKTAPSARIG